MWCFLFGLEGRIGRANFFFIVPVMLGFLLASYAVWTAELSDLPSAVDDLGYEAVLPMLFDPLPHLVATIAFGILVLLGSFIVFAAVAKRLHDRGKGAVWFIPMAVLPMAAIAIAFFLMEHHSRKPELYGIVEGVLATLGGGGMGWFFIELFLLRGNDGDNRFGPDPRRIDRPEGPA